LYLIEPIVCASDNRKISLKLYLVPGFFGVSQRPLLRSGKPPSTKLCYERRRQRPVPGQLRPVRLRLSAPGRLFCNFKKAGRKCAATRTGQCSARTSGVDSRSENLPGGTLEFHGRGAL